MNEQMIQKLRNGLETAFVDSNVSSNLAYKPQFISNNYKEGSKMLSAIEEELLLCDHFFISVAFITMAGIQPLIQTLKELEEKRIIGRIMTTDYLMFTEPKALDKLQEFSNIELRMYCTDEAKEGFHTKGYVFEKEGMYRIIVGSSNMTSSALTKNKEWNTRLVSTEEGEYTKQILQEFESFWDSEYAKGYDEFIDTYRMNYEIVKKQKNIARKAHIPSVEQYRLKPNNMQLAFVSNLINLRDKGEERALLISATGTGKTYASAFAAREINPRRILFLVHREQIARHAIRSYENVFGEDKKFGMLSNKAKDYEADYLFSTMQTMTKLETLHRFDKNRFDLIIIDEVHHAGAESYQRIMKYFKPKFWLGMTASPDRIDGFDIYKLFDHNIAYEIRLQQALEEDLLCPFHYFGITDLEINGEILDDTNGVRNFPMLVCEERVDYILKMAKLYGYCGERVKGLIFCSRKEEAMELSRKFNERGLFTEFLYGADSQDRREDCIDRLVNDGREDHLDYIFTIDIFNEGVDIPEINQVIMLRPTESPIVFVQQLGRGLRRSEGKEYVVVLDFIGNYMNNFMIPIALSGDRTYNKDTIRRYVREGARVIPGSSTIHFDAISKKRIFESIDRSKTTKKFLIEKYLLLKNKLGKIPTILDFYDYGEIDPMLFISYAKTYHRFLKMADKEYKIQFTPEEEAVLEFVSSVFASGKRIHELLMLELLMEHGRVSKDLFRERLEGLGETYREEDYLSCTNVLSKNFMNTQSEKKRFKLVDFFDVAQMQESFELRATAFYKCIRHVEYYRELDRLIQYGMKKYHDCFLMHDEDNLVLYQKYSRKDVCRILNWEKDDSSTIYGYRIKHNTCPIFVTYEKMEDIASSTKYEDQFIDEQVFSWMTRSKVSTNSPEAQNLIHFRERRLKIFLFIKKSDGEGTDFYYMGRVYPKHWKETTINNDKGQKLPIMNFHLQLEHSVRSDIYEYFTK